MPQIITADGKLINVKHKMPELWNYLAPGAGFGVPLAIWTGNHMLLILSMILGFSCAAWFYITRQMAIRRALTAHRRRQAASARRRAAAAAKRRNQQP